MSSNSNRSSDDSRSDDLYRFKLSGGAVTNLEEYDDGIWKTEDISRKERWTFDGVNLIQTKTSGRKTTTTTYGDSDRDGVFTYLSRTTVRTRRGKSDSLTGFPEDSYRILATNGQTVTKLEEYHNGKWKNESIDKNESWIFNGTTLTQTETKLLGIEVTTYTDPNNDSVFTKVSEIFTPF